ncbi:MAG: hypothetical protein KC736_01090 [Candidatus Moranbacteria bacterium]|nr:hypothetical protein [Candidatus Moranbacteria bacterium]
MSIENPQFFSYKNRESAPEAKIGKKKKQILKAVTFMIAVATVPAKAWDLNQDGWEKMDTKIQTELNNLGVTTGLLEKYPTKVSASKDMTITGRENKEEQRDVSEEVSDNKDVNDNEEDGGETTSLEEEVVSPTSLTAQLTMTALQNFVPAVVSEVARQKKGGVEESVFKDKEGMEEDDQGLEVNISLKSGENYTTSLSIKRRGADLILVIEK